jgi:2-phospho-L-lactate/phosphoenolpyruvate guanylyltransferase
MTYRALIPVKRLTEAKSRLATDLSQQQRAELVLAMLHHVIQVLQGVETFTSIAVVSPDPRVLQQATLWGALAYQEEQQGHNPALEAAARRELAAGASALLTISADLPLLKESEIEHMVRLSEWYRVVLGASQEGTGTNARLVRPPLALPYLFGPGSLQRHEEAARVRHLSVIRYESKGTSLDVDTIHDLQHLWQSRNDEQVLQSAPNIYEHECECECEYEYQMYPILY